MPSNRALLAGLLALLALAALPPAAAGTRWLSPLAELAERAFARSEEQAGEGLEAALPQLAALGGPERARALAATIGADGHWTFVNSDGERLTAAGAEEVKRVPGLLLPGAAKGERPRLYLAPAAVFEQGAELAKLPFPADLCLVAGGRSYPLRRGPTGREPYLAEVRPGLVAELLDRRAFAELLWQLARPVRAMRMRIVALEPGGAEALPPAPRTEAASGLALIDAVDPYRLARAIPAVAGQTVVIAGRIDGRLVHFRPASGAEQSLILDDLLAAAAAADANLVVLSSATPQQPGGRSWLWQRVEVASLGRALERATLADFLEALAAGQGRFRLESALQGDRLMLRALPGEGQGVSPPAGLGGLLSEVLAGVTGKVVASGVEASLVSSRRLRELEARIVPGIPSRLQLAYLGMALAGLLGLGPARQWWRRLWPPEERGEYGRAAGYLAARIIRAACFILLFLPAAGLLAAAWAVAALIGSLLAARRGAKPGRGGGGAAQST